MSGGPLGSVADGVGTASDKLGGASDMLQDRAGGLVTGAGGAPPPPQGSLKYKAGELFDLRVGAPQSLAMQSEAVGSPSGGSETDNHTSAPLPIEYVHYSRIHVDMSDNFDGGNPPHGLSMRDGLLREAVLLHGFVSSARSALADKMQGSDAGSKLIETAGALLGGAKKQADAGPEVFDPLLDKIHAAVAPIVGGSFNFQDVHKAGVDLHEVRSSFDALYKTALKPGSGGGDKLASLKKIGGLDALAGPIGKIPGYLFRAQDTYLSLMRAALDTYTRGIEDVCSSFSIAAIRGGVNPTWPVWFARSGAPAAPGYVADNATNNQGLLEDSGSGAAVGSTDFMRPAKNADNEFERERAKDVTDKARLMDTEPGTADDCVYKSDVQAAVAVLKDAPPKPGQAAPGANLAQSPLKKAETDATMTTAYLDGALGDDGASLRPFLTPFIIQMSTASMQILDRLFLHLLDKGGRDDLTAVVQTATREALAQKIVAIAWDLLHSILGLSADGPGQNKQQALSTTDVRSAALSKVHDPSSILGDGKSFAQGALANKAAEMAGKLLTEHSAPLNALIDFISGDLNRLLKDASDSSNANGALTMETFLGRLPLLHATLIRDSTFPVLHLILGLFGNADKLAMGAWNPVGGKDGVLTKAGDAVGNTLDAASNARNRLGDVQQRLQKLDNIDSVNSDSGDGGTDDHRVVTPGELGDEVGALGSSAAGAPGSTKDQLTKKRDHGGDAPALAAGAAKMKSGPFNAMRVDGVPQQVTRGQIASAENLDAARQVLVSA
ncbi:MAG: hypothetical protein ACREVL_04160 [Solimonas sp.]